MREMDRPPLPTDPRRRMGVYKSLAEVPDRYRLKHHADAYEGRDVWGEFMDEHPRYSANKKTKRVGRYWTAHMEERGRHHALATPADVETFITDLLEDRTPMTVYSPYWSQVESFYDWLQWHTDHPHHYHPILMATIEGEASAQMWEMSMSRNRRRQK